MAVLPGGGRWFFNNFQALFNDEYLLSRGRVLQYGPEYFNMSSKTPIFSLTGLSAATFTPFTPSGDLNLGVVESYAQHLLDHKVGSVFITGTTGEGLSLTFDERKQLAKSWAEVAAGTDLKVVAHVGSLNLAQAQELAVHAERVGVDAISIIPPFYYKPDSVETCVACCESVTRYAPKTPFYLYHIPSWTGVHFSAEAFLHQAQKRIPTLCGIKYSHMDLMELQVLLSEKNSSWDILFGCDEALLSGLALGVRGAIGSTYNFAAPIYLKVMKAFADGDLAQAQHWQLNSVRLIQTLGKYRFLPAAKHMMDLVGIPCGPVRLPLRMLEPDEVVQLDKELEELGAMDWLKA